MPVRPALIDALGSQETGGEADPDRAVSSRGAVGRYHIEPATARAYGFDPARLHEKAYGRTAATTILGKLIDRHEGNEREGLKDYYGRGTPPKGHPTAEAYADKVLKMAAPATLSDKDFAEAPKTLSDADMADLPGSVFDKPSDVTKVQRAQSKVAGISRAVIETAVPVAAGAAAGSMVGPEASAPVAGAVRTVGAALGGLLAPYAGYISDRLFGEHPPAPTPREALHSAVVNAAWTSAGEVGGALTKAASVEDSVRNELNNLPQAERTVGRIKQIRAALKTQAEKVTSEAAKVSQQDLRNRDFWKGHGLNDQQIDQVVSSPELQQELAQSIQRGQRLTAAYQTVKASTEGNFKDRYKAVLGPFEDVKTDSVPIGQQFENIAQSQGQHELTPTFRGFLQRKG